MDWQYLTGRNSKQKKRAAYFVLADAFKTAGNGNTGTAKRKLNMHRLHLRHKMLKVKPTRSMKEIEKKFSLGIDLL